jgi:hypothetical protein
MEQITLKPRAKRRNVAEIKLLLEDFARSGMTVQSFCNQHNIGQSTFHKWQSRYKGRQTQTASKAFADIEIVSGEAQALPALFAEVKGIRIYQRVSAAYLKALLL